jgi:hypothetical protein
MDARTRARGKLLAVTNHAIAAEILVGFVGALTNAAPPTGATPEEIIAQTRLIFPELVTGAYAGADRVAALLMRELNSGNA